MNVILTISVVHSCFILYEKLPLQFNKSLQLSEGSRTHTMLIDLQPLTWEVPHVLLRTAVHFTQKSSKFIRMQQEISSTGSIPHRINTNCTTATEMKFTHITTQGGHYTNLWGRVEPPSPKCACTHIYSISSVNLHTPSVILMSTQLHHYIWTLTFYNNAHSTTAHTLIIPLLLPSPTLR